MDGLTKDAQKALAELKKQAELEPTDEVIRLNAKIKSMKSELSKLNTSKDSIDKSIEDGERYLGKLDDEIINADATLRELKKDIYSANRVKRESERESGFQARALADLKFDLNHLQGQFNSLHEARQALQADRDNLTKDIIKDRSRLSSIRASIVTAEDKLKSVNSQLKDNTRKIEELADREIKIRKSLADKHLEIQKAEERLKGEQAEEKLLDQAKESLGIKPSANPPQHLKL